MVHSDIAWEAMHLWVSSTTFNSSRAIGEKNVVWISAAELYFSISDFCTVQGASGEGI